MVPILLNLFLYLGILLLKLKYTQWSSNAYHIYSSINLMTHSHVLTIQTKYRTFPAPQKLRSFSLSISTFPPNPGITTILSAIIMTGFICSWNSIYVALYSFVSEFFHSVLSLRFIHVLCSINVFICNAA